MRAAVAIGLLCTGLNAAAAELPGADANGWYAWRVTAADHAPETCCYHWQNGITVIKRCNLDGRHGLFGSSNDEKFLADEASVYAFIEGGATRKIRALSAQCPVAADSAITDLGKIGNDASVEWLQEHLVADTDLAEDAIAAVALHAGAEASQLLLQTAKSGTKLSPQAMIWLVQLQSEEAFAFIERLFGVRPR